MGLAIPAMRLIIREHKKEPFESHALTLGRMAVLTTYEQILQLFKEEGLEPKQLDSSLDKRTNIPRMRKSAGRESSFTSDVVFFKLLGVDCLETMDISDYENAEHIHDMNTQVPSHLACKFDAIFDFGTTEHIFDTKQALQNISRMLRPGGRVLHLVPATNRIGHGYYMFSPGLFYDYYWANGFIDCRAYLVESGRGDPSFNKWKLFRYEYNSEKSISRAFRSRHGVGVFFVARKTDSATFGVDPIQFQFRGKFVQSGVDQPSRDYLQRIKRHIPVGIKRLYYRFQAAGRIGRRNGGLKYLGRI